MKPYIYNSLMVVVFFLVFSAIGLSKIWYVDDDSVPPFQGTKENPYKSIHDGILSAANGDTVLVAPGTYVNSVVNLNFGGKAITVKSDYDFDPITDDLAPEYTIIDGNEIDSAITFDSNEGPDTILMGFTITNGKADQGGGIYCYYASPKILDNIIYANDAPSAYGGGIYFYYSDAELANNDISFNNSGRGGAILCQGGLVTIDRNTFEENYSSGYGGAIFLSSDAILTNNVFKSNYSGSYGGAIEIYGLSPTLFNNLFMYNQSDSDGGAIYCTNFSTPKIYSSTFFNNEVGDDMGGGICCAGATVEIKDCIFWNNMASLGSQLALSSSASTLTISYSDVEGGQSSVYVTPGATLNWGLSMIEEDPHFVTGPMGECYLSQPPCQPLLSPCVNAGSDLVSNIWVNENTPMDELTTRTDHIPDVGYVDLGYHHHPLSHIQARFGNVNQGSGSITDVLFINDSIGDPNRVITASVYEELTFRMETPPEGPMWANFVLYVFVGEAGPTDMSSQPYDIGMAGFPTPLTGGTVPLIFTVVNNIGLAPLLGDPLYPSGPAPTNFLTLPPLSLPPMTLTFQGFIADVGSSGPGISLTNAIVLNLQ